MLAAVPIVLACHAVQPCQAPALATHALVRSASPAAIVNSTQPRVDLSTDTPRPLHLALQRVTPAAPVRSVQRAQVTRPGRAGTAATKGMLVFAGMIAGCYVGAYLGEAMEENGGFVGMPIGAAIGGLVAWALVR
jgi:hypothetical protein